MARNLKLFIFSYEKNYYEDPWIHEIFFYYKTRGLVICICTYQMAENKGGAIEFDKGQLDTIMGKKKL